MFSIGKRSIHAHRFAYSHWKGEIIPGLWVLHTCGRKCVNPAHLELGSAKKNNLDDKKRDGTLLTGTRNPSARYTEDEIREIRTRYAAGETQTSIARSFGIRQGHVSDICLRKVWKDLE
jgi:DNA invertase Pin-like site-specific DNA recombinase